ncbi:MAG: arylamine N-acetyltransferase [Caulobacteraceae bacterium]|nr:arylamine N-acetyltransferase [Caulobacteraceae bacterium]
MKADNFDLDAYLARIGFEGQAKADLATVRQMMRRQLMSVPFENLDVQAGKIVSLVPEDIAGKILGTERGGYCYEVNALFAMALEALGIDYQFLAARPMFYPARRPRTHMVVLVRIDGEQWVCDTGFGSFGIRAPMNLAVLDEPVRQDFDTFRLVAKPDGFYLVQALVADGFVNQYEFNLDRFELIDFEPANYFNSTHPSTIFVQKPVIIQYTETGRNILAGANLKTHHEGRVEARDLEPAELKGAVREMFNLAL